MESVSKIKAERKTIEAIIHKCFAGEETVLKIRENQDGWFNALYEVDLVSGKSLFLKFAPPHNIPVLRYEKNIMKTEVDVLRILDQYSVPVPEVLAEDFSRTLIGTDYFIMNKVEGQSYSSRKSSLTPDQMKQIDLEKGRINKRINDIAGKNFGIFGRENRMSGTWSEAFLSLVSDILQDADDFGAVFPLSNAEIFKICEDRKSVLDEVKNPSLVHWDLHDGNLIINDRNQIAAVIDADRALWGDPCLEFYFSDMFPSPAEFFNGYGFPFPFRDRSFRIRRSLYDLYLTLIFVVECRSRNITDKAHIQWALDCLNKQLKVVFS